MSRSSFFAALRIRVKNPTSATIALKSSAVIGWWLPVCFMGMMPPPHFKCYGYDGDHQLE